jgi:alpha-tubulin suppressor-like RCC1 family protein
MAIMVILTIQVTADVPLPLPAPTGSHSIAICTSGTLIGFGNNNSCQMGNGSTSGTVDPPVAASSLTNVVATSTGGGHSLALKDDGSVWVWGFNNLGQSAQSGTADVCTPTEVGSLGCAVAVSAGGAFSMALMADGTIYTWGSNSNGQLGTGSMSPSSSYTPVQVTGISNAIAISAGINHAMALLDDGTVKVWGNGYYGQMGNSTSGPTASNNPTPISPSLTGIVRIEAGGSHNLALQNSGKLFVWGYNLKGQLGLGDYTDRTVPTSSAISSGTIVDMAAGINHTIILNSNGTLRVCGNSVKRELGICSGGTYNTGQNGPTISGIVDVQTSSSFDHNLAVTSSGALYTWGNNDAGQLGVGSGSAYECNPQHVNYSGSGVCSVKPSVDIQPQPCCVAIQDEGRITLEGNFASGSMTYYSQSLALTGPITLTSGNHYLVDCDVVCEYDASITINSGARLYIQSGSHLYACGDMWHGIDAKTGSRIYVQSSSLIEDAEVAVDVEYGALYNINTAIFNKNYTHFYKHMPSGSVGPHTGDYIIAKSKFLCQTTASIGLPTPVHTTLLAPHAGQRTDVALLAVGVPKLLVGNTNAANANTVDNANWGIFDWTVGRVQVMHNILRDIGNSGVYAVYGPGAGGETIDIIDNDFLRIQYPVFCYDNSPTVETHITDNDIDFAGMSSPPTVMTGITYAEISPASGYDPVNPSNSEYNYVDISNNDILNAPCGIQLVNLTGDQTAPTAKLYVGENYITHTKTPNDGQAGIKTSNVRKGVFKANEVKHPTNNVNWWETGMRLSDGYGNALTCNKTHDVGRGIFLDGTQTPDTRLILNEMQNNQIGLFLNWSVIGAQGASGDPRDNKWLGTSWSSSDPDTHVEGTDGALSPFYVQSSYPYNPQYNEDGSGGNSLDIFTTSGSWSGGCIYTSGASFKTDGEMASGMDNLLSQLPTGELTAERERSQFYMAQYNLYGHLKGDMELTTTDAELEAFVMEHNETNLGKMYQVVRNFRQARAGGETLATAEDLLNAVQPENLVEQTLKDVFSILYAHATDLTALDEGGEARLREIAQLCPLDYGFGVYTARSALLKLDTMPKNYVSECEMTPSPEQMSEKRGIEESNTRFTVYPNPNNGLFMVGYKLKQAETGAVQVFDMAGRQVFNQSLSSEASKIRIDLKDLSSGIYSIRLSVNGSHMFTERISILRQ